jgi:hypothetical protein
LIREFLSFDPTETVKKLLDCIERCAMQFFRVSQQAETHTKLAVQGLRIIANNVQTAASRGAVEPEGANDHMPSGLNRFRYLANIREALF